MNKLATTIFIILSFGIIFFSIPYFLFRKPPEKSVGTVTPREYRYEPDAQQAEFEKYLLKD